jgi:RND family efflux transporter MFP subunit
MTMLIRTIGVLIFCLTGCSRRAESPGVQASTESATLVVPVARAALANLSNDINLTAEFQPYQEVDVMAKVSGYVRSIKVDIGDRLREGQLIATLEIPEMQDDLARAAATIDAASAEAAMARDAIRRAESQYQIAHLSFTRIQDVSQKEKGLVPQQEVDEAHSRDEVAQAQIAEARSRLQAAEQHTRVARTEEARVKTLLQYATITAPFTGVITKRFANTGSMIQAGTSSQSQAMPLVRLAQNDVLRLVLPVPESAVSRIHVGETLDVHVTSLNKTFPGRVARSTGTLQMSTRTMDTQVDVRNPSLTLLPGMYAEVNLRLDNRENVLSVPTDSIEGTGAAARVFVVRQPGTIQSVGVATGVETAQKVEIRSGIAEGDMVVVGRRSGLKDGQRVEPKVVDR